MPRASSRTQEAGTRLANTAAQTGYEGLFKAPAIEQPDQGLYGVLQQGRAQALVADAANPYGSGAAMYALGAGADRERYEYGLQLQQAQQAQAEAQKRAIIGGLTHDSLGKAPDDMFVGQSQGWSYDANGNPVQARNATQDTAQNINIQTGINDEHTSSVFETAGRARADGFHIDPTVVERTAGTLTNPDLYNGKVNVLGLEGYPGIIQTVEEKETNRSNLADEAVARQNAASAAVRAAKGDDEDGLKMEVEIGVDGNPTVTAKGNPAQIAAFQQREAQKQNLREAKWGQVQAVAANQGDTVKRIGNKYTITKPNGTRITKALD